MNFKSHEFQPYCTDPESISLKEQVYNEKNDLYECDMKDEFGKSSNSNYGHEQNFYEFSPYDYRNEKNPTSFWGTVFHLIIIATSPTLLTIPATFRDVGYVIGFVGSFLIVCLYMWLMHKLLSSEYILCKRLKRPRLTYADLIYYSIAGGPPWIQPFAGCVKQIVYIDMTCIWNVSNAVYVLLVSENVKSVYDYIYDTDVNARAVMAYVSVPLVLLCWIPNLKLLTICSICANIINACSILIILFTAGLNFNLLSERRAFGDIRRIPLFVGTIYVTINATGMIMPLKNEMKNPEKFLSKTGVINLSYIFVSILYSFFGLICYVKYGNETKQNVILHLPENYFSKIVIGLYAVSIMCFYPIVSYVSYDMFWNNIIKHKMKKTRFRKVVEYIVRTICGTSSVVLAFMVPNIALFVSLIGTIGTSLDSIIFPAMVELLVSSDEKQHNTRKYWKVGNNIAIILLGLVLMVAGASDCLTEITSFYN